MQFYLLLVLVTLAAFSAGAVAASRGVSLLWWPLSGRIEGLSASRRARWLLTLRLLPSASGVFASLVIGATFLGYEPRGTREEAGGILIALSVAAIVFGALALSRAVRLIASDSALAGLMRHCRQWRSIGGAAAAVLETSYPVAAVAGVFQPRLILSARVVQECTPAEIERIVAHERAHVRRRDNLARALLGTLPDWWLAPRANAEMERAWTRAAEEAADGDAAGHAGAPRAALAATLIRVARMADAAPPPWMPQLAFYQGTDLEHRVRTLLTEPRRDSPMASVVEYAAVTAAVALTILAFASAPALHVLMELSVTLLP